MKKYIGKKTIKATPMAKSEAEKVLNRVIVAAQEGEDGYLVEDEDGYKSWSPKETFEQAYMVADTHLDRMRIEYAELKQRYLRLLDFKFSEKYRLLDAMPRLMMARQGDLMREYLTVLGNRIDEAKEQEAATPNATLVGLTVVDAGKCDCCPSETTDCKKLILADGSHICVKRL